MTKTIRYKLVKVERWTQEGNRVYLVTEGKEKYRYVGRNSLQEMNYKFPKDSFLKIRTANSRILSDDQISRC